MKAVVFALLLLITIAGTCVVPAAAAESPASEREAGSDVQAALPTFGNGKIQVRLYSDYFCTSCRYEPSFYGMLAELVDRDLATIIFIDVPSSPATSFYARYFLYALLGGQRNWEKVIRAKLLLHDAAVMYHIGNERQLESYLVQSGVRLIKADVAPMMEEGRRYASEDGIRGVPSCVIVRGSEKEVVSGLGVRAALRDILENAP